ncbi:hypothetical protein C8Q77DRAFT_218208 [Trametes polyzona]|nr:hypothetical protein C8Q77DRAFT_218208 [Trametes polyzona]
MGALRGAGGVVAMECAGWEHERFGRLRLEARWRRTGKTGRRLNPEARISDPGAMIEACLSRGTASSALPGLPRTLFSPQGCCVHGGTWVVSRRRSQALVNPVPFTINQEEPCETQVEGGQERGACSEERLMRPAAAAPTATAAPVAPSTSSLPAPRAASRPRPRTRPTTARRSPPCPAASTSAVPSIASSRTAVCTTPALAPASPAISLLVRLPRPAAAPASPAPTLVPVPRGAVRVEPSAGEAREP